MDKIKIEISLKQLERMDAFWRGKWPSREAFIRDAITKAMDGRRKQDKSTRVVIDHAVNSGRRRGWAKLVTGVDRSQRGGYAILGRFLNEGEIDLPAGSVLVRMIPEGSVKYAFKVIQVQRVTEAGLEDIGDTYDLRLELPSLLDKIEQALG